MGPLFLERTSVLGRFEGLRSTCQNDHEAMLNLEIKNAGKSVVDPVELREFFRSELGVHYRVFSPRDMNSVLILEHSCFGSHAYNEQKFQHLNEKHPDTFVVGEVVGDVVAYVIASTNGEEGQIIAVDPTYRRFGVAQMLLQTLLTKLQVKGVSVCYVNVRPGNEIAIAFFQAIGFQHIDQYRGNWKIEPRDGSGGYMMIRTFKQTKELSTAA